MLRQPIFSDDIDWKPKPQPISQSVLSSLKKKLGTISTQRRGKKKIVLIVQTDGPTPYFLLFFNESQNRMSFPNRSLQPGESYSKTAQKESAALGIEESPPLEIGAGVFIQTIPTTTIIRSKSKKELFRVSVAQIESYLTDGSLDKKSAEAWQLFISKKTA